MAKGISLHIGLNSVDPNHYNGWSGDLLACEADANDMEAIAISQGFATTKFLTQHANRTNILKSIRDAAKKLVAGDIFLVTCSSHGGQLPDQDGDESDRLDETWCLFDGQLMDDELYLEYCGFKAGVRILVISDSCNSGSVARFMAKNIYSNIPFSTKRRMPTSIALSVYLKNKAFYDNIISKTDNEKKRLKVPLKSAAMAEGLLIGAAQDGHSSYDGTVNGAFTEQLKIVWNGGLFSGNYRSFKNTISSNLAYLQANDPRIDDPQTPNYFLFGSVGKSWDNQTPFKI